MLGLGSNSVLGIGLRVYLVNQFTSQANQVTRSMQTMGQTAKDLRGSFETMRDTGLMLAGTGYVMARSFGNILSTGMKFEHTMTVVKAVSNATNEQLHTLSQSAKDLSREFPFLAQEIADGMERIAKGGIKANALPELTRVFLAASTAAREQFGGDTGVAEMMTDMMQAWNFTPKQAAAMGNMITTAALESTTSFRQIYESFTYSQDTLKNLNVSLEESLALVALIGNQGIKASRAGIALQNMYKELTVLVAKAKPGSEKRDALASIGITPEDLLDAQGNMKGALELLSKLKEGVRDLTSVERENILFILTGVRGKRAATPLTTYLYGGKKDSVTKSLKELKADIIAGAQGIGSMQTIIDQLKETPEYQWALVNNAWHELKITMYEALPLVLEFLKGLKATLHTLIEFAKTPVGKAFVTMLAVLTPVVLLMGTFRVITGSLGLLLMNMPTNMVRFGQAAKWAWSAAAVGASRYLGITRAAAVTGALPMFGMGRMRFNSVGSLIGANGRIAMTAATIGRFGPIGQLLTRLSPMLTRMLVPIAGLIRLATPIGILSGILSMFGIGLKAQLVGAFKVLVYTVMTAANALMGLIELLSFGTVSLGGGGFWERQKKLGHRLFGQGSYTGMENERVINPVSPTEVKNYDNQLNYIKRSNSTSQPISQTVVNIYQDGKLALTKHINNGDEDSLNSSLGLV